MLQRPIWNKMLARNVVITTQINDKPLNDILIKYDSFFHRVCVRKCITDHTIDMKVLSSEYIVCLLAYENYCVIYNTYLEYDGQLTGHEDYVLQVQIFMTVRGERIITTSQDNTIRLWNSVTYECETIFEVEETVNIDTHVDILPCKNAIINYTKYHTHYPIIRDLDGRVIHTFDVRCVTSIIILPSKIIIFNVHYVGYIFDLHSKECIDTTYQSANICPLVLPNNLRIVVNDSCSIWDPLLNKYLVRFKGLKFKDINFHLFNNTYFLYAKPNGMSVKCYNFYTGQLIHKIKLYTKIYTITSLNNTYIIIMCKDRTRIYTDKFTFHDSVLSGTSIALLQKGFISSNKNSLMMWK